jgi:hypothetical protein
MAYREACEKREAVARMAVAQPEQLARDPWAAHLRECPECRESCTGMARSLAVFRRVETERLAAHVSAGPSWERVALAMQAEPKHRLFLRRYRLPVAAAVGGMLVFSGAGMWYADQGGSAENSPARIVRLEPEQQQHMQQVVRQSLSSFYGSPAVSVQPRPAPRLAPIEPIAAGDLTAEPNGLYASGANGLYASGDRTLPGESVFRQTHPFLEGRDMAAADDRRGQPQNFPLFPVMSGPPGSGQVSFPVFRPNAR